MAELFISLDGHAFGEGAPAYFGYLGPELERRIDENVAATRVMLMGPVTYEIMSATHARSSWNHPSKHLGE